MDENSETNCLIFLKVFMETKDIQGCWNQGGRGVNCPPTFAKISPKFLQNGGFCLKFLLFAPHPHPTLDLAPHLKVSSNSPVVSTIPIQTQRLQRVTRSHGPLLCRPGHSKTTWKNLDSPSPGPPSIEQFYLI